MSVLSTLSPARSPVPVPSLWPGLGLTGLLAGAALALHRLPGAGALSPLILAIVLGIAVRAAAGAPDWAKPGIAFSLRRLLRLAVMLLGLQLTATDLAAVGATGLAIILATVAATLAATKAIGRVLGVDRRLAELIAAGTAVCGASAVIATNTVTEARDEDVAYAIACVTVFGSLSMLIYPALPAVLALDAHGYGLWAGASIHEVAQVVAAGFQDGRDAGEFATIAKLSRVMALAPLVILLGLRARRRTDSTVRPPSPMPWFVLGFIALAAVNSLVPLPALPKAGAAQLTTVLLTLSLAAMGLGTDIGKLRAKGPAPLLLGALSWIFIAGFSLMLIKVAI